MIIKTTQRHLLSCLLSLIFLPNMVAVNSDHFQGCLLARAEAESADLVIFKDHFTLPTFKRPPEQLWMIYLLGKTSSWFHNFPHQHHHERVKLTECPLHTQIFKQKDIFNWTATYRGDSTIVAPYERSFPNHYMIDASKLMVTQMILYFSKGGSITMTTWGPSSKKLYLQYLKFTLHQLEKNWKNA